MLLLLAFQSTYSTVWTVAVDLWLIIRQQNVLLIFVNSPTQLSSSSQLLFLSVYLCLYDSLVGEL